MHPIDIVKSTLGGRIARQRSIPANLTNYYVITNTSEGDITLVHSVVKTCFRTFLSGCIVMVFN